LRGFRWAIQSGCCVRIVAADSRLKVGLFPGDGQAGSQVNTVASFLFADKLEI